MNQKNAKLFLKMMNIKKRARKNFLKMNVKKPFQISKQVDFFKRLSFLIYNFKNLGLIICVLILVNNLYQLLFSIIMKKCFERNF